MPKQRGLWTEDQMREALQAIKNGMSVRTAAKEFKIPRRTLRSHVMTGKPEKKIGRPSLLSSQQESELCRRIFRLADVGMPLTSKVIRRSVHEYCLRNGIATPFSTKGLAGRKWLKLFLGRHPDVAKRKSQFMNPARAAKLNRFIVEDYFEKLKIVMLKLDVIQSPQRIFNIDEKGCRLNLHKSQQVFARKGAKRVHLISQEHAENVSIVACGNAIGQMIPPMVLFKGKRKKEEWLDNLPAGTVIEMTEKGSMTTPVFIKWVHHFAKYKPAGKVLLIFDGASSHLDAGIVDAAESHDITLFCLPSNCTHELQPMDKAVFKAFESYWDDEVITYWTNKPDRTINKFTFGTIFSKVWPKATAACNVISGFRATGIYPYDSKAIPDIAFAPSEITEHRFPHDNLAVPSTSNSTPLISRASSASILKKQNVEEDSTTSESSDDNYSLHDSSDDDNTVAAAQELSVSFNDILETPEIETKKDRGARKKSLNYRAQEVTKALFNENKPITAALEKGKKLLRGKKVHKRGLKKIEKEKSSEKSESWYCYLCTEDVVKDMRLCDRCKKYVHEECVGLTAADKDVIFLCPNCTP